MRFRRCGDRACPARPRCGRRPAGWSRRHGGGERYARGWRSAEPSRRGCGDRRRVEGRDGRRCGAPLRRPAPVRMSVAPHALPLPAASGGPRRRFRPPPAGPGVPAGPAPGVPAGPAPGVPAGPAPGVPAGPAPGVPAGPAPGVPAGPAPGVPAGPAPGVPAGPAPGVPAGPAPGVPAGPAPGVPAGPAPGVPAGPAPGVPAGPAPGVPAGPAPGVPAGPAPGVPAGPPRRKPSTAAASAPGVPAQVAGCPVASTVASARGDPALDRDHCTTRPSARATRGTAIPASGNCRPAPRFVLWFACRPPMTASPARPGLAKCRTIRRSPERRRKGQPWVSVSIAKASDSPGVPAGPAPGVRRVAGCGPGRPTRRPGRTRWRRERGCRAQVRDASWRFPAQPPGDPLGLRFSPGMVVRKTSTLRANCRSRPDPAERLHGREPSTAAASAPGVPVRWHGVRLRARSPPPAVDPALERDHCTARPSARPRAGRRSPPPGIVVPRRGLCYGLPAGRP